MITPHGTEDHGKFGFHCDSSVFTLWQTGRPWGWLTVEMSPRMNERRWCLFSKCTICQHLCHFFSSAETAVLVFTLLHLYYFFRYRLSCLLQIHEKLRQYERQSPTPVLHSASCLAEDVSSALRQHLKGKLFLKVAESSWSSSSQSPHPAALSLVLRKVLSSAASHVGYWSCTLHCVCTHASLCCDLKVAEELQSGPMSTDEKELLHLLTSPHLKVNRVWFPCFMFFSAAEHQHVCFLSSGRPLCAWHRGAEELRPRSTAAARWLWRRAGRGVCEDRPTGEEQGASGEQREKSGLGNTGNHRRRKTPKVLSVT